MKRTDYIILSDFKKALVKKIHSLKKKGATYREIADIFNSTGIDTVRTGTKWHDSTVLRFYNNNKG